MKNALTAANLPLATPGRGDNGKAGDAKTPGTTVANIEQQAYFADVATKVVLPMLKARNKPFVLVYWSRDPDGTQHNQGDSHLQLVPGINGPTSHAAIRNADDNLKRLRDTLTELGLADTTNIIIAADHGFSTMSKESATSPAAKADYASVPKGLLPQGFVAIDLAKALGLPLFETFGEKKRIEADAFPRGGSGLIGNDPAKPDVVVAANGGSDLIYLPSTDRKLAARVVDALMAQDYTSGIFVRDDLGPHSRHAADVGAQPQRQGRDADARDRGELPLLARGLRPAARLRGRGRGHGLQQGQGMHGNFSRADTNNFMAAIGPDFKKGFVDEAPVSNADVGKTIAHLLELKTARQGHAGRTRDERGVQRRRDAEIHRAHQTLRAGRERPAHGARFRRSAGPCISMPPDFPGRTLGLPAEEKAAAR